MIGDVVADARQFGWTATAGDWAAGRRRTWCPGVPLEVRVASDAGGTMRYVVTGKGPGMDTIVIATGMPFFLGFLDQQPDDVVALREAWTRSGELVAARHEDPAREAIVRLQPASMGVVESIPHE